MTPKAKIEYICTAANESMGYFSYRVGELGVEKIVARDEDYGGHGLLFYDVYYANDEIHATIGGRFVELIGYFPKENE